MRDEALENQARASEAEVEDILRTATSPRAAVATLVELLTALDVRRRCRETMALEQQTAPRIS